MKLELLDAYNIRARLSASIILLAPVAITLFLCFEELSSLASSSVILLVLLALANYLPIWQRRISAPNAPTKNYAAQMLHLNDSTFDKTTKARYYKKLASLDDVFLPFGAPDDSESFQACCESAVLFLRNRTRENRLVQEENINYGLCKNLLVNKNMGIIVCILSAVLAGSYSVVAYKTISNIPAYHFIAFFSDILLMLFWIMCASEKALENSAIHYAKALIMSIDTFENNDG